MLFLTWAGILVCLTQSAIFSGLNLAFFSISKLRLELHCAKGNKYAPRVLKLRNDSNFLLVTILWGNVAVNVLLALLSGSVLAGFSAFLFSTVIITIIGEIIPQAYFSRHALKTAYILSPLIAFYQILFYPLARPTAIILDKILGREGILYYREEDLSGLITLHMDSGASDIQRVEGKGAVNFLAIDDLPISAAGKVIDPSSVLEMEFKNGFPLFPEICPSPQDCFIRKIESSGKKWIILTDKSHEPRLVLNSDKFIRGALFDIQRFNPKSYCFRPVVIKDPETALGDIIPRLSQAPCSRLSDILDKDIIILWSHEKRVLTGSDILKRLLRGIIKETSPGD